MTTSQDNTAKEPNPTEAEHNELEQENLAAMDKMRLFFKGLKDYLQNSSIDQASLKDFMEGITVLETTYEKRLNKWKIALHHQKLHFQKELEQQPARLEHKERNLLEKVKQLEEKSAGQKEHINQLSKSISELKGKIERLKAEATVKDEAVSTAQSIANAYKKYEKLYFDVKAKYENSPASKPAITSFWKKKP
ncbi:MAG: hypothetical protein QM534_17865 [Sediminibacterium sp.]|nr:hypothetical protein [Sediminibacterium sp.]